MADTLVSIVIPCYRQARFLPATIQSVRNQTYQRIEIIVVNDGSDDDTDEVMKKCGENITYLKRSNSGVSSARNTGLAAALGDYLMFLDADDLLHPNAIQWLMDAMQGSKDRLCVMGFRMFDTDPNQGEDRFLPVNMPALPRLFNDNFGPPNAFLCSREMAMRLGGFEAARIFWGAEDWDLWLRMSMNGCELVTIEKIGAYYRRYSGSASTNLGRAERATALVLARAARRIRNDPRLMAKWGGELQNIRERIARAHYDTGYHAARRGAAFGAMIAYVRSAFYGFPISASLLGMVKAMAHAARARMVTTSPLPVAGA